MVTMRDLPKQFLDLELVGIPVVTWLTGAAAGAVAWVAITFGRRVLVRRLAEVAARTDTVIDDAIVEILRRTRGWYLVAIALSVALAIVPLPARAASGARHALLLATLWQVGLWSNALWRLWLSRTLETRGNSGRTAIEAASLAGRVGVWIVLVLVALDNVGINISALVTGLGVTGIAVALAVQNVLGDVLASLSIVLDKPFEVGDAIAVDAFEGTVEHIGLKTTRVRALDGEQIVFANAELLKARIRNLQRRTERRVLFVHTLDPAATPDALAALPTRIREAIEGVGGLRFERAGLRAPTPEGLEFETVYWVPSADFPLHATARDAVLRGIQAALHELQIPLITTDATSARRIAGRLTTPRT
jgi:small-conductance mechanosensitive channel